METVCNINRGIKITSRINQLLQKTVNQLEIEEKGYQ